MNPLTEHRYALMRYVALYALFAASYAAVFGAAAGMPAGLAVLDGAVFGAVSGFEGLILWNILRYGTEGIRQPLLRVAYYPVVGVLFVAAAVGAESAAIYAAQGTGMTGQTGNFAAFAATIPARTLCIALVYAFFALWYSYAGRSDEGREEVPGMPDVPGGNTPSAVPARTEPIERVTVRGGQGKIEVIGVDDIVYLQAEGDYVAIVTASGRWLKEGTMKYFEEALPRGGFVRVHRSYIVSVPYISRIEASGRERSVVLRGDERGGGVVIRISDAGYALLRRTLGL